tara:strand:+ start:959 stop:1456 length:498 start_codon:yes stop_codon:yes gene_type:complete
MPKSYQHEVPSARVNITLDVETSGALSKKELPMKLLMLGNFSQGKATDSIAVRERIDINKHSFNHVLESINPAISFDVENKLSARDEELPVHLSFKSIEDFKPEQIISQVPELQKLMAMRNLLKDLKASIIDNRTFRKALELILNDVAGTQKLLDELNLQSPLEK